MGLAYFVYGLFIFNALFFSPVMANIGGEVVMNPKESKYYVLAEESLQKYQEQTGERNLVVIEVTRATEQVVAGFIIRLHFDAQPLDVHNLLSCRSEIFEPIDSSPKEITVTCDSL